jgi:hypothetical protein
MSDEFVLILCVPTIDYDPAQSAGLIFSEMDSFFSPLTFLFARRNRLGLVFCAMFILKSRHRNSNRWEFSNQELSCTTS